MIQEIQFLGCEHLDYSDNYSANKEPILTRFGTKICWNRPVIDPTYPSLVQFCKKRGRLNNPQSCLCESNKMCSDFNDFNHTVTFNAE